MVELESLVEKIRSKNAGPFWLTIDIFCGNADCFRHISSELKTPAVAQLFSISEENLKRFDIGSLNVVKFSMPRPVVQGTRRDRDMHGAQWAVLLAELEVQEPPSGS